MVFELTYNAPGLSASNDSGSAGLQAKVRLNFTDIVFARNAANNMTKIKLIFRPTAPDSGLTLTRFAIDINGVNAYDSNPDPTSSSRNVYDPTYFPPMDPDGTLPFYEASAPITTIKFYAFANASRGAFNASTDINQTFKIVTVNANDDFIFLNTASLPTYVFLPIVSSTRENLLIIKDISGNAQARNVTVMSTTDAYVENNQRSTIINTNWGCLTLFLEYRPNVYYMWHIANYYRNDIGTDGRFSPSTTVTSTALCDNINIYSTSNNVAGDPDRTTGHNYLFLQNPWFCTNKLCIVVYCGNLGSRGFDNRLVFNGREDRTASGAIDGFTPASNSNSPFVVCKDSAQSTGVIFVSNGIQWYIVGWMNNMEGGGYWEWRDRDPQLSDTTGISQWPYVFISNDSSTYYIKWDISTANFVILKNRNGLSIGNPPVLISPTYNGWPWVSNNNGIFLNSTYQWIQTYRASDFSCIWLIREPRANSVHYHPIVGYIN